MIPTKLDLREAYHFFVMNTFQKWINIQIEAELNGI